MFRNIGGKIKTLAALIAILGIAASVIVGIVLMISTKKLVGIGFLVMLLGALVSWISSWGLFALGENTENIAEIERLTERYVLTLERMEQRLQQPPAGGAQSAASARRSGADPAAETAGPSAAKDPRPAVVPVHDGDRVICPACGCNQPATRQKCWQCGQEFQSGGQQTS